MATIEERAVQAFPHNRFFRYAYSKGATEQDRIARAEERERCIWAAQELVCKTCYEESAIGCRHANDVAKCGKLIELREAMEGGEDEAAI